MEKFILLSKFNGFWNFIQWITEAFTRDFVSLGIENESVTAKILISLLTLV